MEGQGAGADGPAAQLAGAAVLPPLPSPSAQPQQPNGVPDASKQQLQQQQQQQQAAYANGGAKQKAAPRKQQSAAQPGPLTMEGMRQHLAGVFIGHKPGDPTVGELPSSELPPAPEGCKVIRLSEWSTQQLLQEAATTLSRDPFADLLPDPPGVPADRIAWITGQEPKRQRAAAQHPSSADGAAGPSAQPDAAPAAAPDDAAGPTAPAGRAGKRGGATAAAPAASAGTAAGRTRRRGAASPGGDESSSEEEQEEEEEGEEEEGEEEEEETAANADDDVTPAPKRRRVIKGSNLTSPLTEAELVAVLSRHLRSSSSGRETIPWSELGIKRGGPSVTGEELDLRQLWDLVQELGGWDAVSTKKKWSHIATQLGADLTRVTNGAFLVKGWYQRFLLPYEQHLKSAAQQAAQQAVAAAPSSAAAAAAPLAAAAPARATRGAAGAAATGAAPAAPPSAAPTAPAQAAQAAAAAAAAPAMKAAVSARPGGPATSAAVSSAPAATATAAPQPQNPQPPQQTSAGGQPATAQRMQQAVGMMPAGMMVGPMYTQPQGAMAMYAQPMMGVMPAGTVAMVPMYTQPMAAVPGAGAAAGAPMYASPPPLDVATLERALAVAMGQYTGQVGATGPLPPPKAGPSK